MERYDRIKWLKSIYPEFEENNWNYDNVYKPWDLKYFDFFYTADSYNAVIDPKQIIGIEYAYGYNCYKND